MQPKNLQAKKRHHYVWASYLTRWGNGTKNVFYTTKTGKIAHDSVRAIAADDYFYKTTTLAQKHVQVIKGFSHLSPEHLQKQHMSYLNDFLKVQQLEAIYRRSGISNQEAETLLHATKCNIMENLHSSHEDAALKVLTALAGQKLEILQDNQNMIEFMMFFGQQIARTKAYRDEVLKRLRRHSNLEREVADAIAHSWWFLSYMFGMNIGFSLYSSRHDSNHALLVNDTDIPFITSDHPVVNVHPCVSESVFSVPEHADFYYPISPNIAYIICDSKRFTPGKHSVSNDTVTEFNTKIATQAMVHIIGNTDSVLAPLKKHIGLRYARNQSVS
ncbi:DUF4238 domain-containing protein [Klebsiella aerogenes]|nr:MULTISPECIES: DUF4238 domain-containing protein [Klebsiella]GJK96836.1 hypothetical protein TUM17569_22970 [Klebsiella oxytoca]MBZ6567744.1 DUF4238 domain-containing protein [Klebsiella grimontii]MBZ7374704.1 DUF4238 domain-containing protein [Klebsiella grimontii]MDH0809592.1 DUF4238 domain-containing protein [Klebsiella grimontii]MDH2039652.1 DUF4238 domain-containing protein [Klebsiella grimontii]